MQKDSDEFYKKCLELQGEQPAVVPYLNPHISEDEKRARALVGLPYDNPNYPKDYKTEVSILGLEKTSGGTPPLVTSLSPETRHSEAVQIAKAVARNYPITAENHGKAAADAERAMVTGPKLWITKRGAFDIKLNNEARTELKLKNEARTEQFHELLGTNREGFEAQLESCIDKASRTPAEIDIPKKIEATAAAQEPHNYYQVGQRGLLDVQQSEKPSLPSSKVSAASKSERMNPFPPSEVYK